MTMRRFTLIVMAAVAALLPAAATGQMQERVFIPGQGQGTLTLFERTNFGGAAITFRQTENRVRVPFNVRSIIAEGSWRICPDDNGRGRCVLANRRYADSLRDPGLNFVVRSAVPQSGGGGNNGGWFGPVGGQTLRGTQSQYWPAPEINRRRVDACPNGNNGNSRCAAETADRFCRFAGWRSAQFHHQARINNRWFLADTLCTNR